MSLTRAKLEDFVKARNASGFSSNLQFQIDASEAGFDSKDLGQAFRTRDEDGQANGYRWDTPVGLLRESTSGQMWIE